MVRLILVMLGALLLACSNEDSKTVATPKLSKVGQLTVYKTPSCGCCGEWVDHALKSGFGADVVNQESVAHIKDRFGIPASSRSCHTAVSDEGFFFEGHVPAKFMQQFLQAPPADALGLVVPGMPLGSPGMEYQDQFNPYNILLMQKDGSLRVYAAVSSYDEQF